MRPHDVAPPEPGGDAQSSDAWACGLVGPFDLTLAGDMDAPATAQAAVAGWLSGHVDQATLADVQRLVAELVANRVRHVAGSDDACVRIRVEIRGGALHLEVRDGDGGGFSAGDAADLPHGDDPRGVVAGVPGRSGDAGGGTRVWAQVGVPADAAGGSRDRAPVASLHIAEDEQEHAALAAQARADGARRRARAARRASDRAATEYARRSHHRVADLHAAMARHFEDLARGLRVRDDDRGPDAA